MSNEIDAQDVRDIADAHIMQKGLVAFKVKDGEVFIFTDVTLRQLLEKAESSPERKAIVFVPFQRGN